MSFHVGQKVVCFTHETIAKNFRAPSSLGTINIGDIVTIREIDTRVSDLYGCAALRFEEYPTKTTMESFVGPWDRPAFPADTFRPLIERKTDISALTALLNPKNHKVLEGA